MHFLTSWFIRNPVAANLMMMLILYLGVSTALNMRIEGFPRVPADSVLITINYPNASAAQVDELVTRKIERALQGMEGVRSITSYSENDFSSISVRRSGGINLDRLLNKIRLRIDGISNLPSAARRPVIETTAFDFPALYVNLHGETDPTTLQKLSEHLREALLAEEKLSRLKVWGLHEREMRIEVDPLTLRQYDLTIEDLVEKVRASSLTFQAGTIRSSGGNVFLRTDDKAKFSTQFSSIPILEDHNGSSIKLGDLATVKDGFKEGDYLFRFNGSPTTGMEVLVGQKDNLIHISETVHKVVDNFRKQLPSNVQISIWGDASNYISDRLKLLQSNGLQGLLLVILMLSIFLNVRLAFWVAMGIPISVMGALAVAGSNWVDYSLNDITTFGLIIALGILVDDAVVVGESVFEERQKQSDPILGTEAGVSKVAMATIFGVLTTIAAFYPMLLIDNPLGKVLAGFSGIVIFALAFSLIESKFILPSHLALININEKPKNSFSRFWMQVQNIADHALRRARNKLYLPLLKVSIRHRYAVLILFIATGMLGIGMIQLGKIKSVFFPDIPGQVISVNIEMDARAPFELTRHNLEKIYQIGESLNIRLQKQYEMENPPIRTQFMIIAGASSAQLYAELTPVSKRPQIGILDIVRDWRKQTGMLEGATELEFTGSEELAGGLSLKLLSKDTELLKSASVEFKSYLARIKGVHNVRDKMAGGQPELEIRIKPEARSLGFSPEMLATQIGYAFGGAEIQKVQRDSNELRVLIKREQQARDNISDLTQSRLRNSKNEWIAFSSVAEVKSGYVSGSLVRENGKRVNTVSATIDRTLVSPDEISQAIFEQLVPELLKKYPSVEVKKAGELEEMGEIKGDMIRALMLSAVLIYVLMAVPLKSYWQPFVILAIVPFGFVGAAMGHLIMGLPLSLLSFFGMMALTGVVINDSLVLLTRYNQAREEGLAIDKALQTAGVSRFKAIFLTTATTVIGLLPLLLETSEQAQYLIPAAASLAFGEIFSTALMLILVPVILAIENDFKSRKLFK